MDDVRFRTLIYDSEGPRLDFKRAPYKFVGATEAEKSEILKDLLALANAWRTETAYILTGIAAHADGRRDLLGVDPGSHPDDASLQQFVNEKLSRMLVFSYAPFSVEGKSFGVFEVPVQQRPLVAKKRCGVVEAGTVYFRKGSSTAIATAEQIAQMGADDAQTRTAKAPVLEVAFAHVDQRSVVGCEVSISTVSYAKHNPADFPNFEEDPPRMSIGHGVWMEMPRMPGTRSPRNEFWRELADYVRDWGRFGPLGLVVTNTSEVVANNVRVELALSGPDVECRYADEMPDYPESHYDLLAFHPRPSVPHVAVDGEPRLREANGAWVLAFEFRSIRPRESVWAFEPIYVAAQRPQVLTANVVCLASNLPAPLSAVLTIHFAVAAKSKLVIDDLDSFDEAHSLEEAKRKGFIATDEPSSDAPDPNLREETGG